MIPKSERSRYSDVYTGFFMPRASNIRLSPRNGGKESIGQQIARIRKEHDLKQVERTATFRIVQTFGTGDEIIRLHGNAEGALRVAPASDGTRNERLHPNADKTTTCKPSRKVLRRPEKREEHQPAPQTTLLCTFDTINKVATARSARCT